MVFIIATFLLLDQNRIKKENNVYLNAYLCFHGCILNDRKYSISVKALEKNRKEGGRISDLGLLFTRPLTIGYRSHRMLFFFL